MRRRPVVVVYVFADDATVYALRADTGRRLWATEISTLMGGFPAAPTVVGGVVYAMAHGVTALEGRTGRILWQRELDAFGSSVTVAGPRAYIGARDVSGENPAPGRMYGLETVTGATVWSTAIAGTPAWTPAVAGNRVFLGSYTEVRGIKTYRIESFDIATGGGSGVSRWARPATSPSRLRPWPAGASSSRARAATCTPLT